MSTAGIEGQIVAMLHDGPKTTTEIHAAFNRNIARLSDVLFTLVEVGAIESQRIPQERGRPLVIWRLPEASAPGGQAMAVDTVEAQPSLGRDLTPTEVDRLILATVRGMGDLGASEDEISTVLGWAMQTPEDFRTLQLVLDQKLWVRVFNGNRISFVDPRRQ